MIQTPLDHQPLFSKRLIDKRVPNVAIPQAHAINLRNWAATIRNGSIRKFGEVQVRPDFIQKIFIEVLGYTGFGSAHAEFTITHEKQIGAGSCDQALGFFSGGKAEVIAPLELKGANTGNLDAIMPGRHKSPVQQVWEYAMDTPGCKFLVVSNMLEIRLYAVGHTRQIYERFDLLEVADSAAAYHKLQLLLGANNLLRGQTAALLAESALEERTITAKLYKDYKRWRAQLILSLAQSNNGQPGQFISAAQKLLDRVLFVAFAEDRGLLDKGLLKKAHVNTGLSDRSIWEEYQALFRAVDIGKPRLNIPAYNGGLFAFDSTVDDLIVSDQACATFVEFGEYDYAADVSVTVLGHIFEQSIEDLEKLNELAESSVLTEDALKAEVQRASARGGNNVSGKRKLDGVVFTPSFITEFIVEHTLGRHLRERRAEVLADFLTAGATVADTEWTFRAATKTEKANYKKFEPNRIVEYLFWDAWRNALIDIKVCDPACGSGAFLVAAFDLLDAEYKRVNEQIGAITHTMELFDIDREILNSNLYGVDINEESIEISKLSLWLKTAKRGKPLHSLEANLRVGNSLIAAANGGAEFSPRAFDWSASFPHITERGGFDVIIGNPPYVRMERIKPIKPYLERHFEVASDRADLYCYFFELGVNLLRPGGRMGYISSSTFFKTGSGEPLRKFLLKTTAIETVVDFGDLQVFEGVTTYPAMIAVRKRSAVPDAESACAEGDETVDRVRFLALAGTLPLSLAAHFEKHGQSMPQSQLGVGSWQLEADTLSALRAKLLTGRKTLKEVYGSPHRGVVTGLNEAFVVDAATRDALVAADPDSGTLLKPFLEGRDLQRWCVEPQDLWLIYLPKNSVDIDAFPAIKAHLAKYKTQLEARATKQAWFELQQAQAAYVPLFESCKAYFPEFALGAQFSMEPSPFYCGNKCYFVPGAAHAEIALFNSKTLWFFFLGLSTSIRNGWREQRGEYIERLPTPEIANADRATLEAQGRICQTAAEERRDLVKQFGHEVLRDLAPGGLTSKLPGVLQDWATLDFAGFMAAVKKHFKQDIPLNDRNAWEAKLKTGAARVAELTTQIKRAEREIDQIVYRLFDLTPDEIALIEAAVK